MSTEDVRDDELPRNAGNADEVTPVPAATVIVCRNEPLEVLMMRRHEKSSFVPDAWVFPGGALDDGDRATAATIASSGGDQEQIALKICCIRELVEECGVWLGSSVDSIETLRRELHSRRTSMKLHVDAIRDAVEGLVLTSRWITPAGIPKRFDTWFYITEAPLGATAVADEEEAVETRWITPSDALRLHRDGTFSMVFPTLKNLEALLPFRNVQELVAARRGAKVEAVRPVLKIEGKKKRIVLPDEE